MELKLDSNAKLTLTWIKPGLLSLEIWMPGNSVYGHGWLQKGGKLLDGQDLQDFLDGLDVQAELEPPPRQA